MKNKYECPKEVKKAVRILARAVKLVADMADLPSPRPLTEYHAKEYLGEMESLLLNQLLTAYHSEEDRENVLESQGLYYLVKQLRYMAEEWEIIT